MELSRRDLLKVGLFGSAALMLPAERIARAKLALDNRMPQSLLPQPFTMPFAKPELALKSTDGITDYFWLRQAQGQVNILPDKTKPTTIWGYANRFGAPCTPGPTIMVDQGRPAVVRQANDLPDKHPQLGYQVWTSTHLHGSCSLPQYDGYASDTTTPGAFKDYRYPNIQDARTLWYHDHGVHITANNAYMGLAAQYVMHDRFEQSLPIPHGEYDVPLTLKDVMFQESGELLIDDNDQSGIYGDVILVNGVPWPKMKVEPRKYRFRVLNASVSRSYDLSLDSNEPLIVIGTDGGLMPAPQYCSHVKVGMAERYEIVIDFSKYRPGQQVVMKNTSPQNNIDYETTGVVMAFEVRGSSRTSATTRSRRSSTRTRRSWASPGRRRARPGEPRPAAQAQHQVRAQERALDRQRPDVGGRRQQRLRADDRQARPERRRDLGAREPGRRLVPPGPHPPRRLQGPHPQRQGVVGGGLREGPEGRRLRRRVREGRGHHAVRAPEGRYMMHCHNLVHEDHDMMVQFEVGEGGDDPIEADRCKDQDEMGAMFEEHHGGGGSGGGSGSGGPGSGGGSGSTILVPAAVAPAAQPKVKVLGSKVKRKAKKVKRKVKVTHKKPTTKHKPKVTAKKRKPAVKKKRTTRKRTVSSRGRS